LDELVQRRLTKKVQNKDTNVNFSKSEEINQEKENQLNLPESSIKD
jgi:hypothetical protein